MATKNVPAKPANTAMTNYQEQLEKEAAEAASSEVAQSEFVSFRSGILSFNGQEIPNNELDVIVLDSAYEHAFYGDMVEGKPVMWGYDPNIPKSPSCYAFGRVESELVAVAENLTHPEDLVHEE